MLPHVPSLRGFPSPQWLSLPANSDPASDDALVTLRIVRQARIDSNRRKALNRETKVVGKANVGEKQKPSVKTNEADPKGSASFVFVQHEHTLKGASP